MATEVNAKEHILRDLGGGLILRRATAADTGALAAFNCEIHCSRDPADEQTRMRAWIEELMSGKHPTVKPGDFTIVEDTGTGAVVSSLCLISQTWSYGGVKFGLRQPELVGTKPDYRRRGLVRAQFEVVHEWSAQRGHKVQAISGIPNFYRQFGYEMALEMHGGRAGYASDAPKLKKGEEEPYRVRAATRADLPFISRVYGGGMKRYLVSCVRDAALWQHELAGHHARSVQKRALLVIESAAGARVGFLVHGTRLWGQMLGASVYELKRGVSWLAVTPSVMRYLVRTGERYAAREKKRFASFALELGSEHPAYQVVPERLPRSREPYAFYLRVADLPGFLRHIRPVLERRIAHSVAVGYTGELKLNFYRAGVRMVFEKGRPTESAPWAPGEGQSAAFPDQAFLHLLFGHRSLEELRLSYRDCFATSDEARVLLGVLFPKMPSAVWGLA
jgi:hypothetical protein